MRCLVTGGAGFIGHHLVNRLTTNGHDVIIIDDLSKGKGSNVDPGAEFMYASICDPLKVEEAVKGCDIVFHLAAKASVQDSMRNPMPTFNTNVTGTVNILDACVKYGIQKIIFASSCAVYGDTDIYPQNENTPTHPVSPYAVSKLVGEQYIQLYKNIRGLEYCILRLFNVYGAGLNGGSLLPIVVDCIENNKPIPVFGDGAESRDYIYVEDVVTAFVSGSKWPSDIYNIGTGNGISIHDLCNTVGQIMGKEPQFLYKAKRSGDPANACADPTKMVNAGLEEVTSLEDGIEEYLKRR